jgi:hypothetical protein
MNLTVIITASYCPSHPSIFLIKDVLESLRFLNLNENTPILLAHDYNDHPKYLEYLEYLKDYIKHKSNIKIVKRESNGHLTGNIRHAMQFVTTKYVLILQHDLPFIRKVNINKVMNDMDIYPTMKHIRFNKRKNIKAHYDGINNLFGKEIKANHYSYTRTPAWSDQNHICLTSYYNDLILKECKDGRFMENQLYGVNKDEHAHQKYGNYLFGSVNHPTMINHTNGRLLRLTSNISNKVKNNKENTSNKNKNHYYIVKNNFRKNNLNLRCLKDTFLIEKLNHDQSIKNKIPIQKGKLLKCSLVNEPSDKYYYIYLDNIQ